jgi:hypothetical protein
MCAYIPASTFYIKGIKILQETLSRERLVRDWGDSIWDKGIIPYEQIYTVTGGGGGERERESKRERERR